MNKKETLSLLNQFEIKPIHSLGQNFLIDDHVTSQICEIAGITGLDLIIEIGSGVGSLTRELASRAGRVIALEIDRHVLPALEQTLQECPNCMIRQADALAVNLAELAAGWTGPVKVVANLPYYITTPLMVKVFCELPACAEIVMMIQLEAADRVMASPGSKQYGPLAVLAACFGETVLEMIVPAASFYPKPGIDSCIIRIKGDRQLQIDHWLAFHRFLEKCFAQRRKTLVNSLKTTGLTSDRQAILLQWLADSGLTADIRAEKLQYDQFVALYQYFRRNIS